MFTYTIRPEAEPEGPGGDDLHIVADSRDVLRWEKAGNGKRSIAKLLAEPNIADSYILAYLAGKRQKLVTCTPQEFEDHYIIVMTGEESPDPTLPAP